LDDRADLLRADAATSLAGGRAGGAGEVEEVGALGVVESSSASASASSTPSETPAALPRSRRL
jgi:hypothetical protein